MNFALLAGIRHEVRDILRSKHDRMQEETHRPPNRDLIEWLKRQEHEYEPVHKPDTLIAGYPKSGTTWMQMIFYQITTDGSMAKISHIIRFVPHLEETLFRSRKNLNDLIPPWIVKTHLPLEIVPKLPVRYIYLIRHPLDVAVSYYYHHLKYVPNPPSSFPDFFRNFLIGRVRCGSWFDHAREWLNNTDALSIVVVRYEDMIDDLQSVARRVAAFCGIEVAENQWPRIVSNCSFQFMREHNSKFDIHPGRAESGYFIRRGMTGQWREYVDEAMLADYARCFEAMPKSEFLRDYGPVV